MKAVEYTTCTISANEPTYKFMVVLSDLGIDRLRYHHVLGMFRIQKNKYAFLNDLADAIASDVLEQFMEMESRNEKE